jgi:YVTN family beta-propeller protein
MTRSIGAAATAIAGYVLGILLVGGTPVQAQQGSHNSRLALSRDGRHLVTANTDNGSISLVDLRKRTRVAEVPVGGSPEGVSYLGASPRVAVTLWDEDRVVVVDLERRAVVRKIDVPDEPYGVVASADGSRAYVTHAYPGLVTEIDAEAGAILRRFEVGDAPRGIAIAPDGTRLLVAHYYNGWLSAVDLASGRVVDRWKGAASDNLARSVTVHPSLPLAYIPHIRSRVERAQGTGSIFPFVTVVDLAAGEGKRRVPIAMDNYNGVAVPADPWEVAISPDGKRQYTIYGGTDDMNVSEVVAEGYPYLQPVSGLVPLGKNPRGIAVSNDGGELYVLNGLDFSVWVFQTEPLRKVAEIAVAENPLGEQVLLGKRLFHQAGNPMSSRKWISCASCHPGGDHDGRTWQNPEGKRNTTALFGMARTLPLHWSADRDELHDFEHTIRGPLMQGTGLVRGTIPDALGEPLAGRSPRLDALAAYCNSLEPRPSPHALGPGRLSEAAERGRLLFESDRVGCATCHPAPTYTDSRLEPRPFRLHDVGTGEGDPSETLGPAYDTPSLIGVYRSAPYLHDGRAATLRDVLTTYNREDRHGKTSHLKPEQVDDLVAFLKALPYLEGMSRPRPTTD